MHKTSSLVTINALYHASHFECHSITKKNTSFFHVLVLREKAMAILAAVPPPARAVVTSGAVRESYSLICQPCCLNEVSPVTGKRTILHNYLS